MATDGSLSLWGANGPVVWHSETSGLDLWHTDGIWSDYQSGSEPETPSGAVVRQFMSGGLKSMAGGLA